MSNPTVLEALRDPQLLGRAGLDSESWKSWHVALKAAFGLEMNPDELEIFKKHTGRSIPPSQQVRECWIPTGRRGGKSRVAAAVAAYLATLRDYSSYLSSGEKAIVMLIAADQRQAKIALGYIWSMLVDSPVLSKMIEKERKDSIKLTNGVSIEVRSANYRTVRGVSLAAVICDEVAHWKTDEAGDSPDVEIVNALRPGLSTIPHSMIIGISSPYAKRGLLWRMHKDYFGVDSDRYLVPPVVASLSLAASDCNIETCQEIADFFRLVS